MNLTRSNALATRGPRCCAHIQTDATRRGLNISAPTCWDQQSGRGDNERTAILVSSRGSFGKYRSSPQPNSPAASALGQARRHAYLQRSEYACSFKTLLSPLFLSSLERSDLSQRPLFVHATALATAVNGQGVGLIHSSHHAWHTVDGGRSARYRLFALSELAACLGHALQLAFAST